MQLSLNEDQLMLKESALAFCRENVPLSVLRRLRDSDDPVGYDQSIWQQITELGWPGMTIPEAYGGYEFGYMGLGVVLEASGRCLLNSPMISTVLLGGSAINIAGTDEQKQKLLTKIAAGETVVSLAIDESSHHNPGQVATTATQSGKEFILNGKKVSVLDGHVAQSFIVSARTSGDADCEDGISLFLVDASVPGILVNRTRVVDSRNSATVTLDDVRVSEAELLGIVGKGFEVLTRVLDIGRIGLAAEMLGSIQEVFERTVEYLKQREQFGVPIGAFQGLQHRLAEMYCEIELCKSVVLAALDALDNEPDKVPVLASLAKSKLSETFFTVSNEGVQMHGGIGMTDEFDIGFFLKRARVAQQFLGDQRFHRNRYAQLKAL